VNNPFTYAAVEFVIGVWISETGVILCGVFLRHYLPYVSRRRRPEELWVGEFEP
jgi:hypothetical protein